MELKFKKEPVSWMESVVSRVQTQELTQELKLSDGMPDVGKVLCAWGQFVLRGKEWHSSGFSASGGMLVWVLYSPEDGSQPRCIHGWIPGQLQWDTPPDTPDGLIRICCLTRFVDARSVSPRKILVRAGISALGEGCIYREGNTWTSGEMEKDVQLLQKSYPVTLLTEMGEKSFQLEEELTLPPSAPEPGKLVCATIQTELTEQKVLSSRFVFRGNLNLHLLYLSKEGQIHGWDFPVPFSQYDDLRRSHSADARGEVVIMPTELDVEPVEGGSFRIKCGVVGQYAIREPKMLRVVEDAYSPERELELHKEQLDIPVTLEEKVHNLAAEARIPQGGEVTADAAFLPDFPRIRRNGDSVELELSGMFQALTYGPEGSLQSGTVRWEGKRSIPAHPDCEIQVFPGAVGQPTVEMGADGMMLRAQLPLEVKTTVRQSIPMVTGITPGQRLQPDPARPSLILCRAGEESLWHLARKAGSTVEAIREASGLEGEPVPGQMLLIPVL